MGVAEDFFNCKDSSSKKCHYLTENYEQSLEWEKESVSSHSCGIVKDEEILARNIFSPHHYDTETGEIKSLAFDDVLNKGLSVLRYSYTTSDEIISIGEDKQKETHEYLGYVTIQAKCIREYIIGLNRAMAIYDTALEDLLMHADICSIGVTKTSRGLLRIFLKDNFSKLIKK